MNHRQHSRLVFLGFLALGLPLQSGAQTTTETAAIPNSVPLSLEKIVVSSTLDKAREDIVPSLGATSFSISRENIASMPGGAEAPLNQVLLRTPGMAQDSFGQLHLRGEHANLQYRINEVLLPEGISGFGQELDSRLIDTVSILTGTLPAQYGYRTAGVVDLHTKSGSNTAEENLSVSAGSFGTFRSAFEAGGSSGRLESYLTASALSTDLGVENPTASRKALHDRSEQFRGFGYFSYVVDDSSRVNLILSGSNSRFEIPNQAGLAPLFQLDGVQGFDSTGLNERQKEDTGYAVVSYQKTGTRSALQAAVFVRNSGLSFTPDAAGDLVFNGVATRIDRKVQSAGAQFDGSWYLATDHTLRGGLIFTNDRATVNGTSSVFAIDAGGSQSSTAPFSISDRQVKRGFQYGAYGQDEWKPSEALTLNFGLRADQVDAYVRESQLSPRLNLVYQIKEGTSLHAGYARYFTPPPLELVKTESVASFNGTTNASEIIASSPVRSERSHYFDLGISQTLTKAWSLGFDSYLKKATNQLDEGQFGQAIVYSPFNYNTGKIFGAEITTSYTKRLFSAYGNLAWSQATGHGLASGEFLFSREEATYLSSHDVALDHDQRITASSGLSYKIGKSLFYADTVFGSGLRRGFANTAKLPSYTTVNLGMDWKISLSSPRAIHLRLDFTNIFDRVYELRDGSGIGVAAPQYGARRGVSLGATLRF